MMEHIYTYRSFPIKVRIRSELEWVCAVWIFANCTDSVQVWTDFNLISFHYYSHNLVLYKYYTYIYSLYCVSYPQGEHTEEQFSTWLMPRVGKYSLLNILELNIRTVER